MYVLKYLKLDKFFKLNHTYTYVASFFIRIYLYSFDKSFLNSSLLIYYYVFTYVHTSICKDMNKTYTNIKQH